MSSQPSFPFSFQVVAPGRICLFGEHSDYLGFPVIARAVPLFCTLKVHVEIVDGDVAAVDDKIHNDNLPPIQIHLHLPEELGGHSKVYDLQNLPPSPPSSPDQTADFALAAIHEVLKEGWDLSQLCRPFLQHSSSRIQVHCHSSSGELPLQAGCSSSTAFLVAWTLMLAQLAGKADELQHNPIRLAELAWKAEVEHFGHPGGTMDHVAIALGTVAGNGGYCGALRIGPGQWHADRMPLLPTTSLHNEKLDNGIWILADSGEPKDTLKHLKRCKQDRLDLLHNKLNDDWDNHWDCPPNHLSSDEKELLNATLVNRGTEENAACLWKRESELQLELERGVSVGQALAGLLQKHHNALRDGLRLSTPKLEAISTASQSAGAWGFKVVGSGGGGCGVAWAPTEKADAVAMAMKEAGAVATWVFDCQQPVRGACIVNKL